MDRRAKATQHRDEGPRLNEAWGVGVKQARYHHEGRWYAKLTQFPAALFDPSGYLKLETPEAYESSLHISIGKQISLRKPGISAVPSYTRVIESREQQPDDIDIHDFEATEGYARLLVHLRRERSQLIVSKKKKAAKSLNCEACGFSFAQTYGPLAEKYCEVHHLRLLAEAEQTTKTKMQDLAILCANCHRVLHLRNPPYTLNELRQMLSGHQ